MKIQSKTKKFLARIMVIVMVISMIPVISIPMDVEAASAKSITSLGAGAIIAPKKPASADDAWAGHYVWYGKYDKTPVRYRVLAPKTTRFGGTTMLLDCDTILYSAKYYKASATKLNWKDSTIKSGLNGSEFLKKSGVFTEAEKSAIAKSTDKSHDITVGSPLNKWVTKTTALTGEKVFLLDFEDIVSPSYGYANVIGSSNNFDPYATGNNNNPYAGQPTKVQNRYKRNKSGTLMNWWQRNETGNRGDARSALYTETTGAISGVYYSPASCGVSPAFNINLSSILFTSLVSGTVGKNNAEYKLTIVDKDMTIGLQNKKTATVSGTKVSVPYSVKGTNKGKATQASVLILDKAYKAGNTNNAKVLYYGKLSGSFATSGATGTFKMPSNLDIEKWGTDYLVYIIAEDINGTKETDYASVPTKITAPLRPAIEPKLRYRVGGAGISWSKVNGATKYKIYRKNASGEWTLDGTTTSTSYTDKDVVYGNTYTYDVRAFAGDGSQITKDSKGKNLRYIAPAPETTAENYEEGICISWKTMTNAQSYTVYRKDSSSDWKSLGTVQGITYIDTTAVNKTKYHYSVVGLTASKIPMNDRGSGVEIVRNDKFVKVTASVTTEGVKLKWSDYDGADMYRVYRKNDKGGWSKLGPAYDTNYTDTNVVNDKKYTYAVLAVSSGEPITEYGKGKTVKFVTPPTNVVVMSKASGVRAEWESVVKASKYELYRKTRTTDWVKVGATSGLSYTDKSAESGKTYYYSVIALDANGKALNDYGEGVQIKYNKPVSEDAFAELEVPICVEIEDEEIPEVIEEDSEEETSEEDSEEETSEEDSEEETSEEDSEEETSEEDSEEETSEEDSEEETSEEDSEETASEDEAAAEETQDVADEGNGETINEDAAAVEDTDAVPVDEVSEDIV